LRVLLALRQQDWLALMLLGLHGAIAFGIDDPVSQAFLLFHFGCFLLWQPVWRSEQRLYLRQALLIVAAAALLVASASWWLLALWLSVLLALIGGEVPTIKNVGQRIVSLTAAAYLVTILLVWVVPHLFPEQSFTSVFLTAVRYGPLAPLMLIFLIKTERPRASSNYSVDLISSLLLFLMVVVLVLGAFVIKQLSHGDYVVALAQALVVTGGLLVALSWLWDPRAGFAGIGQLVTRYFLSLGMPFERWMHGLANLADRERDPDRFVAFAIEEMAGFPWVLGIQWRTRDDRGMAGHVSRHGTECSFGALRLTLYTRWAPGPSLVLHIQLLARLLADYYEAKAREQEQRRNAYMQAIYETGSRLTHDVKNLLQSLGSLCEAAERSSEGEAAALRHLMQRQLPQVSKRLQGTLNKLSGVAAAAPERGVASVWWQELRNRFAHEGITFDAGSIPPNATLPADLFDRVAENCLQNAIEKRRAHPEIEIRASLTWDSACTLTICDTGGALRERLAQQLFVAPMPSAQGLGVGLYQAARQAAASGYGLTLLSNVNGNVCFGLVPDATVAGFKAAAQPEPSDQRAAR
jgi:signal transduction histidine kinase